MRSRHAPQKGWFLCCFPLTTNQKGSPKMTYTHTNEHLPLSRICSQLTPVATDHSRGRQRSPTAMHEGRWLWLSNFGALRCSLTPLPFPLPSALTSKRSQIRNRSKLQHACYVELRTAKGDFTDKDAASVQTSRGMPKIHPSTSPAFLNFDRSAGTGVCHKRLDKH